MKRAFASSVVFLATICVALGEVAYRSIDDQQHGFAVRFPKEWQASRDTDEKCHLALRSSSDHMMVFVLSEAFDADLLPAPDESLADWGRRTFVREDPKVSVESVGIDRALFEPSVAVSLVMRQEDGTVLKSETHAFTRHQRDSSSRRVWKVFAIYDPALVTSEELAGWAEIKASLKITRF